VQVGGGGPNWNMGGRGVAHAIPATIKPTPAPAMTVEAARLHASDTGLHTTHTISARRYAYVLLHTYIRHIHTSHIDHISLDDLSASEWSYVVE